MAESKLRELSMDFSVDIINLVKYLKSNHETTIANQIGEAVLQSAQIFTKHSTHKAKKILFQSSK